MATPDFISEMNKLSKKEGTETATVVIPPVETKPETVATETPKVETPPVAENHVAQPKVEIPKFSTPYGETTIAVPKVIETQEDFYASLSQQTGKEIKNFTDVMQVINDPNKVSIEEVRKAQEKALEYDKLFMSLSPVTSAIIEDELSGKDVLETMKKFVGTVDYSKPVTAYTENDLILLTNKDYTAEELDEMDEKFKKTLYNASVRAYKEEHTAIIQKETALKNRKLDSAKQYLQSIEDSVADLRKKMPNLEAEKIAKIEQKMREGYSLYDNGKYKPDAAFRIANAEYGEEIVKSVIDQQTQITQKLLEQEISKTTEKMLTSTTNDTLAKTSAQIPQVSAQEEIQQKNFSYLQSPKKK